MNSQVVQAEKFDHAIFAALQIGASHRAGAHI
jgi:hypothetical protein